MELVPTRSIVVHGLCVCAARLWELPLTVDRWYATALGPMPWRAPESFVTGWRSVVTTAWTDMFMLGCAFLEVLAGTVQRLAGVRSTPTAPVGFVVTRTRVRFRFT